MYTTSRYVNVKNTIDPLDCMYQTTRIIDPNMMSNTNSSALTELTACEQDLDLAIQKRSLNRLEMEKIEAEVDRCLGTLDTNILEQAVANSKMQEEPAARGAKGQAVKNTNSSEKGQSKSAKTCCFGKNKLENIDLLIQVKPNYNPKLTLQVISQLTNSTTKKILVRQHMHSSVSVDQAAAVGESFGKLAKGCGIDINTEPGRDTFGFDFVFTFLVTNCAGVDGVDCTVHSGNYTSISGDFNISHFIYEIAGGQDLTDLDFYWCEQITASLENTSTLKNLKCALAKNYDSTGGLADILKKCVV